MSKQELETVAQAMVAKGKGILAADESAGTIKRRFAGINIESNEKKPLADTDRGLTGRRAVAKKKTHLAAKPAKRPAGPTTGDGMPTYTCLEANAHALARYA